MALDLSPSAYALFHAGVRSDSEDLRPDTAGGGAADDHQSDRPGWQRLHRFRRVPIVSGAEDHSEPQRASLSVGV